MFTFPVGLLRKWDHGTVGTVRAAMERWLDVQAYNPIGYRDLERLAWQSDRKFPHLTYDPLGTNSQGRTGRKSARYEHELDQLYNAILRNPYDIGPRSALVDWLMDHGADPDREVGIMAVSFGLTRHLPPNGDSQRWDGPGYICRGPWGLWDMWVGLSATFPQACRAGLFLDNPITTVIVPDLLPARVLHPEAECWYWCETAEAQTTLIRQIGTYMLGWSVAECSQSILNELYGAFLAQPGLEPVRNVIGAYRAFNRNAAFLALSNALVNVGRFTAGLPVLQYCRPFERSAGSDDGSALPCADWEEGNERWGLWIGTQWEAWRRKYRVADWPIGDGQAAASIEHIDKRKGMKPYGRQWVRSLLVPAGA